MNYHNIGPDERAVSEVIGVILMVALTVLLAALVGGAVLNGVQTQAPTPQATFTYESDVVASTVTITHTGGDTFTTANTDALTVVVEGTSTEWGAASWTTVAPVSNGNTHTVTATSGDEIQVVWISPEGDRAQVVGRYTVA